MPLLRLVHWIETRLPGLLLALMTLLVIVDVLGRYVLNMTFAGAAEVATALFVWLVFLGSAGAVRKFQHIGIEGFTAFIPKSAQPWLQLAVSGSILAVSVHMARISYDLSMASWEREIDMVGVPYFYVYRIFSRLGHAIAKPSAGSIAILRPMWMRFSPTAKT